MKKQKAKISYEPEADVLRVAVGHGSFYNSARVGNFIIHLDKKNKPIYLEIVGARDFLLHSSQKVLKAPAYSYR